MKEIPQLQTQIIKGYSPFLILECLNTHPAHGYALTQSISKKTRGAVRLRPGSLYPLLHALERKKLIRSSWQDSAHGPQKKIYSITSAGIRELHSQKKAILQFHKDLKSLLRLSEY